MTIPRSLPRPLWIGVMLLSVAAVAGCYDAVPEDGDERVVTSTSQANSHFDAGANSEPGSGGRGRPSCADHAFHAGWAAPACENGGNAVCGGHGPRTSDCDHCCNAAAPPGPPPR
jgi:hypothetical protein